MRQPDATPTAPTSESTASASPMSASPASASTPADMATPAPPALPRRHEPAMDVPGEDEDQVAAEIIEQMMKIATTTHAHGGHAIRSVHAKSHGLLRARLEVLDGLPPALAQGIFATPARFDAVMRLSTVPGDLLDDRVSTPRGVAIKLIGVPGTRLEGMQHEGAENATTQDFILVNAPRFSAKNGRAFLRALKPVAATTDKAERSKEALSAVLRGTEKLIEALGGRSATLRALGGEPPHHILGETFWTQLPLRHGAYIAKYQLVPVSAELCALTGQALDIRHHDDAVRDAVIAHFREHGGTWELRAQLCVDDASTPLEDPTAEWDETVSPYVAVARLVAGPQTAWSPARSTAVDDGMGFSPWHGVQAHRPLGELMRLRKAVYAASQRFRSQRNAVPVREPTSLDGFPDD